MRRWLILFLTLLPLAAASADRHDLLPLGGEKSAWRTNDPDILAPDRSGARRTASRDPDDKDYLLPPTRGARAARLVDDELLPAGRRTSRSPAGWDRDGLLEP